MRKIKMDIILAKSPIILRKILFSKPQKLDQISTCFKTKKSAKIAEIHKWCAILCDYRTKEYEDLEKINYYLEIKFHIS
jgi:hypothetical protein